MDLDDAASHLIRLVFYALFFSVPLIFLPGHVELFQFNKMVLVYVGSALIAALWAIRMILQKRVFIRKTPFDLPLLLFLGSQVASTIFSIEPHTSIWGYYSRFHGGLLSTLSYLLLYFAFVSNMTETKPGKKSKGKLLGYPPVQTCIHVLLASAAAVSMYGILEHFGIDDQYWVQDVRRRVFSTFGQPNWLAAFLVTVTPLSLILPSSLQQRRTEGRADKFSQGARARLQAWLESQIRKSSSTAPSATKKISVGSDRLSLILFSIFYLTLLFTKSRSGFLGFAVMFAVFWLVRWTTGKDSFPTKQLVKTSGLILLISVIIGTPLTPAASEAMQTAETQHSSPSAVAQPAPASPDSGGTPSEDIRKIVWRGAVDVWRNWPVFGSGVETFAYSYYNFRPREHNFVSEWDFLYNKAHNEHLNILATTGIVGLGSYLSFVLWFLVWSGKQASNGNKTAQAFLSGFLGLQVAIFFGFSTVTTGLLFFMFPAVSLVGSKQSPVWRVKSLGGQPRKKPSALQSILITLVVLLTLYSVTQIGRRWYADRLFARGKLLSDADRMSEALTLMQKASELAPDEPLFHDRLALDFARSAVALSLADDASGAAQLAQVAAVHSDLTVLHNPLHLNYLKNRAATMLHLATIDVRYRAFAQEALLKAHQLAPTDPKIPYNLGLLYFQDGEMEKALEQQKKAVELKPDFELANIALAQVYEKLEMPQKAMEVYENFLNYAPRNQTAISDLERLATESGTRD